MVKKVVLAASAIFVLAISAWSIMSVTNSQGSTANVVSGITGRSVMGAVGEEVLATPENSNFEFEGSAVGKSHVGGFDDFKGSVTFDEGMVAQVGGVIQVASVNTGIEKLDTHLLSDDFFDVENFPEISFISREVNYETGMMTVDLTFRGVTETLSFPVVLSEEGISADFTFDTTPFGMKNLAVSEEVRIGFGFGFG